ncbi:MAG TPA: hypothetical protein VE377_27465 [Candidatus Dormibacteraeota bacterium]|nr:hypothetical protein [Candidatus Dormibacteraeota bacterium]
MRTSVLVVAVTLCWTGLSLAQDHPKAELFGGFSVEHVAPCGESGSGCNFEGNEGPVTGNFKGWNAAATAYFKRSWGITADVAGHYGSTNFLPGGSASYSNYSYMFGPTYAVHLESATPFVHGLFGGVTWRSPSNLVQYNALAWAVGGGVDVNATPRVAVRVVQVDYVGTRVPSAGNSHIGSGFRFSLGFVFKF